MSNIMSAEGGSASGGKKVAILAPTGMLGSMVYNVLKHQHELVLVYRDEARLELLERAFGKTGRHRLVKFNLADLYRDYLEGFPKSDVGPKALGLFGQIGEVDAIINCAGVIKPHSLKDPIQTMFLNGALPHILSAHYKQRLIQITTDCAFSGLSGAPYGEHSPKSPNDLYGLSKSLGEPSALSLVLRTSIVGPELGEGASLIAWFLKQNGQTIKGFTSHLWNGITTKEFGKVCDKIISHRGDFPQNGLYHIFSSDVSKLEMLEIFKRKYKLSVTIEPASPPGVDRRLKTIFDVCKKLEIPGFEKMIAEL